MCRLIWAICHSCFLGHYFRLVSNWKPFIRSEPPEPLFPPIDGVERLSLVACVALFGRFAIVASLATTFAWSVIGNPSSDRNHQNHYFRPLMGSKDCPW